MRFDGRTEDDIRATRRAKIAKLLPPGVALTSILLASKLREQGDTSVDAQLVEAIMTQMVRSGEVIRQEGGAWKLNPAKRGAAA